MTLALFQNDSCVMYFKGIIFERSLSIFLFDRNYVFWEKMIFFLASNTHFTSIFTVIAHYFNPRLEVMYVMYFQYFKESRTLLYLFSKNGNIKKRKQNIKKLIQISYCCSIFRHKFPIILQSYQSFINIYSFQWKLANKNKQKISNACKNKTSHTNT